MTDIDTSPEAVERWARAQDFWGNKSMAAFIRQLAKDKAELEAKVNSMLTISEVTQVIAVGPKPEAEARNAALREVAQALQKESYHGSARLVLALITPKQDEPTTT